MPSGVEVDIDDNAIISACNTPGMPVAKWRDEVMRRIGVRAVEKSPVNDPENARHRAGWVGEFKASWFVRRYGNQHRVGCEIGNAANHAVFVEEGRSASKKYQRFSWTGWGGEVRSTGGRVGGGTRARPGKHILRDACNAVMPSQCDDYTPLA